MIGDIGVGKTSFFENLYEKLDQSEKANTYFLHVDLGTKATLSSDIKTYVLMAIPAALKKTYGVDINSATFANAVYYQELNDFDNGVQGALKDIDPLAYKKAKIDFLKRLVDQRDTHLHASLGHLSKGRRKQIVVVIDNADQRRFAIQQEAFLIAQELAATRNLHVFVALRPSTFYQSKTTGALSAYQNKIFTISPPPADEVIQRRLAFAVRVAEGKVAPAALEDIRLHLGRVVAFLNATLRSIRTNEEIRLFLSNITGGNTRAVIELIQGFFGSPNVDSQKIVRIEEEYGNYRVPLHEFTKHALLGEYAYFNALSSPVACNLFDVTAADPREHFLSSLLVAYLASNVGVKNNDGFINGENLIVEMAKHGYSGDQVRRAFRRLAAKRLIETPHAHYRELEVSESDPPEQFYYRATSAGVYHVRFWTGSFAFLDAMSTDTPIFDQSAREQISSLAPSFEIKHRFLKADLFRRYLETQWNHARIGADYYDFCSLLSSQQESFAAVKRVIEKADGNKGGEGFHPHR